MIKLRISAFLSSLLILFSSSALKAQDPTAQAAESTQTDEQKQKEKEATERKQWPCSSK